MVFVGQIKNCCKMKIDKIKVLCFSPTRTSRIIAERIAKGLAITNVEITDLTSVEARKAIVPAAANEVFILACPVYMGRVPAIFQNYISSLNGNNALAVCVVVYGNRHYDNALSELCDIATDSNFKPVAAGAFVAEHSFSTTEFPIAESKPNIDDLFFAEDFGKVVSNKIDKLENTNTLHNLLVPGISPYGGKTKVWDVDFINVDIEKCNNCGVCIEVCPVDAISTDDIGSIDIEKCITCCACIKFCEQNARSIKDSMVLDASKRLFKFCNSIKKNEMFLD